MSASKRDEIALATVYCLLNKKQFVKCITVIHSRSGPWRQINPSIRLKGTNLIYEWNFTCTKGF